MSVLVWDGNTLACDCAINDGHVKVPVDKMWRLSDGSVIGGVGSVHDLYAMRLWVTKDGKDPAKFPKVTELSHFVQANATRGLVRWTNKPYGIIHGFNKLAVGSGREFAYGALFMGANAEEAVRAAIEYDVSCGHGIYRLQVVPNSVGVLA